MITKTIQFLKKLNLPNKLTFIRLVLVIPFIFFASVAVLMYKYQFFYGYGTTAYLSASRICTAIALLIFMVAMITDYFDGKIARKRNLISEFGKLWDPIADKFMTTSALVFLNAVDVLPIWITLVFILRDLVVAGARTVMIKHNISVQADKMGKYKTMLMSIGLVISMTVFMAYPLSMFLVRFNWYGFYYIVNIPLIIAAILNLISGYQYVRKISHKII